MMAGSLSHWTWKKMKLKNPSKKRFLKQVMVVNTAAMTPKMIKVVRKITAVATHSTTRQTPT